MLLSLTFPTAGHGASALPPQQPEIGTVTDQASCVTGSFTIAQRIVGDSYGNFRVEGLSGVGAFGGNDYLHAGWNVGTYLANGQVLDQTGQVSMRWVGSISSAAGDFLKVSLDVFQTGGCRIVVTGYVTPIQAGL